MRKLVDDHAGSHADLRARLVQVERCLAAFPASVAAACYPGERPPELAPLRELLAAGDPGLEVFARRLRGARPDLHEDELLALPVPVGAGDRAAYLARLGKWRFERRELLQALRMPNDHRSR
ncbi:MAG TPA: hypothetical protein VF171_04045 [Trueperaceae bacterium]